MLRTEGSRSDRYDCPRLRGGGNISSHRIFRRTRNFRSNSMILYWGHNTTVHLIPGTIHVVRKAVSCFYTGQEAEWQRHEVTCSGALSEWVMLVSPRAFWCQSLFSFFPSFRPSFFPFSSQEKLWKTVNLANKKRIVGALSASPTHLGYLSLPFVFELFYLQIVENWW